MITHWCLEFRNIRAGLRSECKEPGCVSHRHQHYTVDGTGKKHGGFFFDCTDPACVEYRRLMQGEE